MTTANLAQIEDVHYKLVNLADTTLTVDIWLPVFENYRNILQGAWRELKSYRPYDSNTFLAIKTDLESELNTLRQETHGTLENHSTISPEKLSDEFEVVVDKIDRLFDLNKQEAMIVHYYILTELLERLEINDYTDLIELSFIDDAENLYNSLPKKSKKSALSYKQVAWLIVIRRETHIDAEILAKKYNVKGAKTLYNRKGDINDISDTLKQGLTPLKRGLHSIISDLEVVIEYFKEKSELNHMNVAIERQQTAQKLLREKK